MNCSGSQGSNRGAMAKSTYIRTLIAVIVIAAIIAIWERSIWPFSVIVGGMLGLMNLKALSWGVEGLISAYKASPVLVFFSMLRMMIMLSLIAWLTVKGFVNIPGVMVGFTIVFVMILKEGLSYARNENK